MELQRRSGILLHPTSLPGTPGVGTIGAAARAFVDWLAESHQTLWQILPLGPTGYGDSPYASFSTFAGNPLMIDLEDVVARGWAEAAIIVPPDYIKTAGPVDFGAVVWWKMPVLKAAATYFLQHASAQDVVAYKKFVAEQGFWLENYSLFMSIKEFYDRRAQEEQVHGAMWSTYWPSDLARHEKKAVQQWLTQHQQEVEIQKVIQFFFFTQWRELKVYANGKGIAIIGDIPIFVAADSADVWANQHLFQLDEDGRATAVAGVPPDYFSATGQLWGNPLYDWEAMAAEGYEWWIARIKAALELVDYIRIDHFRGFESYWAVPAGEETAVKGQWLPGPGHRLFQAIRESLGDIPIIAEDVGVITEEVRRLRDDFELPGMKILQFAFDLKEAGQGGCVNAFLPHMYSPNCVVYTGTHDNDTMEGWLSMASAEELALIGEYLEGPGKTCPRKELCRRLVQLALSSTAKFAVIPLQDIYGLGSQARINTPSTSDGTNWIWRMEDWMLVGEQSTEVVSWLKRLGLLYGRNVTAVAEPLEEGSETPQG